MNRFDFDQDWLLVVGFKFARDPEGEKDGLVIWGPRSDAILRSVSIVSESGRPVWRVGHFPGGRTEYGEVQTIKPPPTKATVLQLLRSEGIVHRYEH